MVTIKGNAVCSSCSQFQLIHSHTESFSSSCFLETSRAVTHWRNLGFHGYHFPWQNILFVNCFESIVLAFLGETCLKKNIFYEFGNKRAQLA